MRSLLLALVLFSSALALTAAPIDCAPGTLQDYIDLGSTGCALSDKVVADFSEIEIPNTATRIDSNSILVTPLATALMPSLTFAVNLTANPGEFFDSRFSYSVSALNPIIALGLDLEPPTVAGDGNITVIKEPCFSGAPNGVSCGAPAGDTMIVFAIDGDAVLSASTALVNPATLLFIGEDIGIDGGTTGSAAFQSVTNTFFETPAVPEPSTWLSAGLGLLLLLRFRRW